MFHIVLVEPEIPQNTGNIARTCAATGAALHLVEPLGFSISDRQLKRAGLDYWHLLEIHLHPNLDDFFAKNPNGNYYFLTTKAPRAYTEAQFSDGDFLIFGKETRGLPEPLLAAHPERCIRIPMREGARSLNLSNSVAVTVFEALRQTGFEGLAQAGRFPADLGPAI
ncbi:tRNA (uridine(34)/cytosine(34)/5-carboxymethylaminomethyluridine(34)-2'-O)-methyltransferase TrmL [Clostridiaceae bacterium]|nr:tRNA (uridine(34)/cytosine(34)/5-carboxymethylaminomethyluridine(34)-2'-O)-methyltransferase TrmL [Clostridiaceae bacterium]NBI84116.1 tRNA (uridine(34)/cytosine(34)/5-carboxymethylaminomethyluridine(34)-2'-O)-methyltransferase TrmL [Clostridiaceae bacterium]